jgi:DNA invertase Pin-like site-specific DNA recombinase
VTRAILYIRQSVTADAADSLSLAFQERTLRQMVGKLNGAVIEPPIVDPDEKGNDPNRPGLSELMQRVETEKPDILAVYAVSRFARDNWLQESVWRRLKALHPELRFISATEPHAEDDLVRGILGVVSQAERKRMGAFLSSAFRERARRGLPHGKTPFGFVKDKTGRLVIDDDARAHVLAIVEYLESGKSLWWIARWLNEQHVDGRTWEPNVVRNTVRTPAIAGGVKCADVLTWESHEPIISRDRWERVCRLLDERRAVRTKTTASWLEGLIVCGCGAPMHLITDRYNYDPPRGQFRCSASPSLETFQRKRHVPPCDFRPRSIMASTAENLAVDALVETLQGVTDAERIYDAARAKFARLAASSGNRRTKLETQLARLEQERERLLVLYRRGTLDVERWETGDDELAGKIVAMNAELASLASPPDRDAINRQYTQIVTLRDALNIDPSQARRILMAFDCRVQRTADGVRLVWPEKLQVFFSDSAIT